MCDMALTNERGANSRHRCCCPCCSMQGVYVCFRAWEMVANPNAMTANGSDEPN